MTDETKNLFDVLFAAAQFAALLIAAVWTYVRFFREGTHKPRIEFDVTCAFLEPIGGVRGAMFVVNAANKGNVEHEFLRISLKVGGLKRDQPNQRRPDGRWNFLLITDFGEGTKRPGIPGTGRLC